MIETAKHAYVEPFRVAPMLGIPSAWRRYGCSALLAAVAHATAALLLAGTVVRAPTLVIPIRLVLSAPSPRGAGAGAAVSSPPSSAPAALLPAPAAVPPAREKAAPIRSHPATVRPRRRATHVSSPPPPVTAAAPASVHDGAPGGTDNATRDASGGTGGGVPGTADGDAAGVAPADAAALRPQLISEVMPEYPPAARLRGVEGQVVLQAIVAADGRVEPDILVIRSVPLLDAAAITALRQWRFRPARDRNGTPLRVSLRLPVRFVLR